MPPDVPTSAPIGDHAFSSLLDPGAGQWSVQPAGGFERIGWRYLPGTLVAETTLSASAMQASACSDEAGRYFACAGRLGNFPQAIAHVGLIDAASALTEAEDALGVAA